MTKPKWARLMRGGVYVWRTRKPGAIWGLPIIGRHFAYVGETTSFSHREAQHRENQPWSDLEPVCVLRIPLPAWKPLLRAVETLLIVLLWPVYNHSKNLWNPRRIDLRTARLMRQARDRGEMWVYRVWLALRGIVSLAVLLGSLALFGHLRGWW